MLIWILGKKVSDMKIYIVMMSDGKGHSSASPFQTYEEAEEYVEKLEGSQKYIEGNSFKGVQRYYNRDLIVPPFFNNGKMMYCSIVTTLFRGEESFTWRVIYEQDMA